MRFQVSTRSPRNLEYVDSIGEFMNSSFNFDKSHSTLLVITCNLFVPCFKGWNGLSREDLPQNQFHWGSRSTIYIHTFDHWRTIESWIWTSELKWVKIDLKRTFCRRYSTVSYLSHQKSSLQKPPIEWLHGPRSCGLDAKCDWYNWQWTGGNFANS